MTLYDLADVYRQFLWAMEEDELDEDAIKDTLEALDGAFEDKADNYAVIMQTLQNDVDAIDKEMARLKARRDALKNNKERLKEYLENAMRQIGKTKFKTQRFSFGIQKNGGKLPVIIDNENALPERFKVYSWKVDTDGLRSYLETMGTQGFAHLGERGEGLRIR